MFFRLFNGAHKLSQFLNCVHSYYDIALEELLDYRLVRSISSYMYIATLDKLHGESSAAYTDTRKITNEVHYSY